MSGNLRVDSPTVILSKPFSPELVTVLYGLTVMQEPLVSTSEGKLDVGLDQDQKWKMKHETN